jgi:23S rRNA (cytidine1920-2'-O)/16S rRNA (cytidine1409-2'-O)-methyltransferase
MRIVRLLGADLRYVSRGGLKLEKALEHWRIDLRDKVCLDVGASTGGFSDCMLQHGAAG